MIRMLSVSESYRSHSGRLSTLRSLLTGVDGPGDKEDRDSWWYIRPRPYPLRVNYEETSSERT